MNKITRQWTPEENERLKQLVSQGASVVKASAVLKRKMLSVHNQARKLGTPFVPLKEIRKKWVDTPSNPWRLM